MRKQRKTPKPVLGDGTRTGTDAPVPGVSAGGQGSSMVGMLQESQLLQPSKPTFIDSPFGHRYLSRRARAVHSDEVQARYQTWGFNVKGYWLNGVPSTALRLAEYNAAESIFVDWYTLARQQGKAALKYKHLPLALTDTTLFAMYWNVYHYAVANCTALLALDHMYQYNVAFGSLSEFLPRRITQVKRMWRRLQAIHAPMILKAHAIRSGLIVHDPPRTPPIVRLWSHVAIDGHFGGPDDYTDEAVSLFDDVMTTLATLDVLISNINIAVMYLETNITNAAELADVTAIKDMIDMIQDVVPGAFVQGLPNENDIPGVVVDVGVLNDIFHRSAFFKHNEDSGTDQWLTYPVPHVGTTTPILELMPMKGRGTPGLYEFTLLGGAKVSALDNSDTKTYTDQADVAIIYGTDIPLTAKPMDVAAHVIDGVFGTITQEQLYTRDNLWVDISQFVDLDNGGATALWQLKDSMAGLKDYAKMMFTEIGGALNTFSRLIDEQAVDYTFWMAGEDLCGNYGQLIASSLGVPYLR
jgi:hypothetical protein